MMILSVRCPLGPEKYVGCIVDSIAAFSPSIAIRGKLERMKGTTGKAYRTGMSVSSSTLLSISSKIGKLEELSADWPPLIVPASPTFA